MYVCKEGHMAIRKARQGKKNVSTNQTDTYCFDIEKCKIYPQKEGCYKDGDKSKTYSVTIKSDIHKSQIAFQESEYFKEKSKERYKIEAKNSDIGMLTTPSTSRATTFTLSTKAGTSWATPAATS